MSEELDAKFTQASENVTKLSKEPDGETKLKLYGLYKQSTQGECAGERPGMLDFVKRAKYDAWKACEGRSQDEAKQQYIDYVAELVAADKG